MKTRKIKSRKQRKSYKGGMPPTRKKHLPHNNYIKFIKRLKETTGYNLIERSKSPPATSNSFFPVNNKGFTPNNSSQPPSKKQKKNQ